MRLLGLDAACPGRELHYREPLRAQVFCNEVGQQELPFALEGDTSCYSKVFHYTNIREKMARNKGQSVPYLVRPAGTQRDPQRFVSQHWEQRDSTLFTENHTLTHYSAPGGLLIYVQQMVGCAEEVCSLLPTDASLASQQACKLPVWVYISLPEERRVDWQCSGPCRNWRIAFSVEFGRQLYWVSSGLRTVKG